MARQNLGDFEQLVLLACMRLEEDAYAVSIMGEIQARTGRSPSHSAVYVALRRLEERGLIETYLGKPTSARGGKPKRHVRVRPNAVAMLRAARDDLMSMWSGLDTAHDDGAAR